MSNSSFKHLVTITLAALAVLPLFYFMHKVGVVPPKKQSNDFNRIRGLLYSSVVDFEDPETRLGQWYMVNEASSSGKYSCRYNRDNEYGYAFTMTAGTIHNFEKIRTIGFETTLLSDSIIRHAGHVLSVEDVHSKPLLWMSNPLDTLLYKWDVQSTVFKVPEHFIQNNYKIKVYVWNKGHEKFYADDFKLWFSSDSLPPFEPGW